MQSVLRLDLQGLNYIMSKRILLIVSGGIAAYKVLEFIRRVREHDVDVRAILTKGGGQFVTPLSLSALTENKVYQDLFSLTDESEMGHINLSRQADLLLVAPASADIMAKMANGQCNDLATTTLLATDKPVLVAPAMNVRMWDHPATQANLNTLIERGVGVIGPTEGPMACGEFGMGRMAEPDAILASVLRRLDIITKSEQSPLNNKKILVTSGPTQEAIDPVRFIANKSSGRQGHAIAAAFAAKGADVTLVSGPTQLANPIGVNVINVISASEMYDVCINQSKVDIGVFAAAVADWRVEGQFGQKIKKQDGQLPDLKLIENPDILQTISKQKTGRPKLVIGFAAETENIAENAKVKRQRKGCDWILANDVSTSSGTFGGDENTIHLITPEGSEDWPRMTKQAAAQRLVDAIENWIRNSGNDK